MHFKVSAQRASCNTARSSCTSAAQDASFAPAMALFVHRVPPVARYAASGATPHPPGRASAGHCTPHASAGRVAGLQRSCGSRRGPMEVCVRHGWGANNTPILIPPSPILRAELSAFSRKSPAAGLIKKGSVVMLDCCTPRSKPEGSLYRVLWVRV